MQLADALCEQNKRMKRFRFTNRLWHRSPDLHARQGLALASAPRVISRCGRRNLGRRCEKTPIIAPPPQPCSHPLPARSTNLSRAYAAAPSKPPMRRIESGHSQRLSFLHRQPVGCIAPPCCRKTLEPGSTVLLVAGLMVSWCLGHWLLLFEQIPPIRAISTNRLSFVVNT